MGERRKHAATASTAGTDEPRMERLTWLEVQAAIAGGCSTVIVACGAVEQHGPHLPLFVDAEHADRLALEVARRLGGCLVAPTIRVGCSAHHLAFPGTISLRPETLERIYEDYCTSLTRHGFRTILCFSGHGGNFPILARAEQRLNDVAAAAGGRVLAFTDLEAFLEVWRASAREYGGVGLAERVGGHADVAESSVLLALWPQLVRWNALEPGYRGVMDAAVIDRLFRAGFASVSRNGILGDPTGMARELGERCIERMAAMLAEAFRLRMGEPSTREGAPDRRPM